MKKHIEDMCIFLFYILKRIVKVLGNLDFFFDEILISSLYEYIDPIRK